MKFNTQNKKLPRYVAAGVLKSLFKVIVTPTDWLILPLFIVCLFAISSAVKLNNIKKVSPLVKILKANKRTIQNPLPLVENLKEVSIPKVEEIFQYYSFEYTSLGFGLKNLNLLEEKPRFEAEKMLFEIVPNYLKERAKKYIRPVLILSEKHQIDPLWVLSIMWTESHFVYTAKSHVGATGLMQLMPDTKSFLLNSFKQNGEQLAIEEENFSIGDYFHQIENDQHKIYTKKLINIEIGIIYLKRLLKQFNYNHKLATVAYNMGPGWTAKRLRQNLPVGKKNEYLEKVTKAYQHFLNQIRST